MLIFADSLFVESVTVKFRKYGEISVLYLCLLFFVFIQQMEVRSRGPTKSSRSSVFTLTTRSR